MFKESFTTLESQHLERPEDTTNRPSIDNYFEMDDNSHFYELLYEWEDLEETILNK